jgi:protein DJ-1
LSFHASTHYNSCSRNIKIIPDTTTIPTTPTADILILPGGVGGAKTFSTTSTVQSLIRAYRDADRYIGVICASTTALVASAGGTGKTEGLESGRKVKVTSHPSVKEEVVKAGWEYSENRVVVDGKVITTRGPGTTMGFALKIVELLAGEAKRREIAEPMICADILIGKQ